MGSLKSIGCVTCAGLPWSKHADPKCVCSGFHLDVACGSNKQLGFLGMDLRDLPGVDFVWDIEKTPWPFKDMSVGRMLLSHIVEHIKPWVILDMFAEMWRILQPGGQALIVTPHAGSIGFWQDITHVKGWHPASFAYFDPTHPGKLYDVYKPLPWKIVKCHYSPLHNIEAILEVRKKPDGTPEATEPSVMYVQGGLKSTKKGVKKRG